MNEKLEENRNLSALCRIYKSDSEGGKQASLQVGAIKGTVNSEMFVKSSLVNPIHVKHSDKKDLCSHVQNSRSSIFPSTTGKYP